MRRTLPAILLGLVLGPAMVAPAPAAPVAPAWTIATHPCPGPNRTDALHRDGSRLWVGCGTNASGYGLFHSADGVSWSAASVTPASVFDLFRVSSISTGHDDALYVAGTSAITGNRAMVYRVDTSTTPFTVTLVLEGVNQVGRTFHVGGYRELWDGSAIAEDLNGTSMLFRPDAATGTSAADWVRVDYPHHILDLQSNGDSFLGGGSRINEPPRVFLPPLATGAEPWDFVTFTLPTATGWVGEIWGVASVYDRIVAVGVDQDADTGKIFLSGEDPYVAADYVERSVTEFLGPGPGQASWARGVCAGGEMVVVVGERQPLASGTGFVLASWDRGESFVDVTPPGVSASVSKCIVNRVNNRGGGADEPDVIVAGAAGFIGLLPRDHLFDDGFE